MKKISVLSTLTLSSMLLMSCSQMKKTPSREMSSLMETVQIEDDEVFEKAQQNGEYTHEMAEADADDDSIKTTVGDAEIDKELPDSENNEVPYARNFLAKKNTKRMQFWVDYFTKQNRDRMQRFINNGEEYRHHIEAIFEAHGLPKELYFVGLIESGYYLGARSHASAVGPWQFIRGTGARYGLKITSEIDERQDLFKSTKAAAMYFKDMHNVLSSWELALAGYNAGEYGIIRRIMKHGTRDFYELSRNKHLPSETINYVPKVLAAMHVVNNAEKYGFVIPKKKHRLFDLTELKPVKKNISLVSVARRMNIDVALLKKLNPELRRTSTPRHFAGTYYLRVPKSKYSYRLDEIAAPVEVAKFSKPESRRDLNRRTAHVEKEAKVETEVKPKLHHVRRGETLVSIARKYNMTPRELAMANDFKSWRTRVKIGQRLKLEERDEQKVATRTVAQTPKVKVTNRPIVYKVKRGDNLTDLARLFDLNVSKIKTANNLKRGQIQVGQKIVLPGTQKGIYTVRKGDHLTKVAREFNQPIEALVKINSLKQRSIYPGQKIIVNMD
ncbi:lytic transglycosylase domain-containing protein [Peredibacter starrii]|uniref:LysM peptidoglycan-binding domain-containing protein n=1 Tax=Peredibacter starrii TaxID=28202 RepID=A0AAX4HJD3_9BACT|nr:LysM peptidoglycan-binding domain-containing protein [Peredibacter starrii]WPU63330.1 LysM peptidoglycan-binding domain-containing protein [Peredibacter starrii]